MTRSQSRDAATKEFSSTLNVNNRPKSLAKTTLQKTIATTVTVTAA